MASVASAEPDSFTGSGWRFKGLPPSSLLGQASDAIATHAARHWASDTSSPVTVVPRAQPREPFYSERTVLPALSADPAFPADSGRLDTIGPGRRSPGFAEHLVESGPDRLRARAQVQHAA